MVVATFIEQAVFLVVLVSGLPLLVSTGMSLVLAIVQAATQIQEQSIGFLVKVGAVGAVFAFGGHFFYSRLLEFFQYTLVNMRYLGG